MSADHKAPLEKLPLAAKKDLRDNWETKKEEIEKTLSGLLGTEWKFEVEPLALHAYASSGDNNLGQTIAKYYTEAIPKMKTYLDTYGEDGKKEINEKVPKHILALEHDDTGKVNYCACDIKDGKLRMTFKASYYGSYCGDALGQLADTIEKETLPAGSGPLSFYSQQSIKSSYDPKIDAVQKELARLTGITDIKLTPNFEQNVAVLAKNNASGDWRKEIGDASFRYFNALNEVLKDLKFGDDEMLREGFQEAITAKEVKLNVLEKLVSGGSYNEIDIDKSGVLNINSTVSYWGSYVSDPAKNIIDKL